MKSRKVVLTVLLLVLGLSTVAHASAVKVAFVDFDFLVGAHPEYELKVTEFQDTRAKMIESFQKEIADIESESEIDAIAQKYDLELQELYEEMQTYLVESILGFIEEVAKRENVSLVLPYSMVLYGELDLTEAVMEEMYASYGISVPSYLRLYFEENQ